MTSNIPKTYINFFALVFGLSIPFWILGAMAPDTTKILPVLFHTMINISPYLIPNYGSHYDPFVFTLLLIPTTIAVIYLWGTKTLSDYKYNMVQKAISK